MDRNEKGNTYVSYGCLLIPFFVVSRSMYKSMLSDANARTHTHTRVREKQKERERERKKDSILNEYVFYPDEIGNNS
jgi:hypothetical protein